MRDDESVANSYFRERAPANPTLDGTYAHLQTVLVYKLGCNYARAALPSTCLRDAAAIEWNCYTRQAKRLVMREATDTNAVRILLSRKS